MARGKKSGTDSTRTETYRHPDADSPMRPDVGTQAQFKKTKAPKTYRYDSSLSPVLDFDSKNSTREEGEVALREILDAKTLEGAKAAAAKLKALSKPFLNWAGKAERLSFDVPTLPLFVHERLSTKAILETIKGHRSDKQIDFMDDLFGDPRHSIADQVLKSYEHRDKWVNRMVLGDSLVVMNSLLHYEGLGGQLQMVYIDPPYGVKFGSNFQPFVRKRDVSHGDDNDMTREPEVVQAYRDTWELGLHSYLTYMRDRLLLARELLSESGSVFVQISDENLHHVRELMDEVFGAENFISIIAFQKTGGASTSLLATTLDYIIWYARDKERVKFRQLYLPREIGDTTLDRYDQILLPNGKSRRLTPAEISGEVAMPEGRRYQLTSLLSDGETATSQEFSFQGTTYKPRAGTHWKTTVDGLKRLAQLGRIEVMGTVIRYRRFVDDFPVVPITDRWESTQVGVGLTYVVQTSTQVIQRCVLMTTDPGDLVLDPTCGSGTTAYVCEQWGRRWITIDTSRVPLALARQRLLTATFPFYKLNDESRGPSGGFIYERKQNKKGEETGGIVPHITLKSLANNEKGEEEVLVDHPETSNALLRVSGPFVAEGTIPTPISFEGAESDAVPAESETFGSFTERMLEVLRKSPVLRLDGKRTITLKNLRVPTKSLSLSAEAIVPNGKDKPVALVFGPENGAVSERLVFESAKEANAKSYATLYVIGFAIQPNARALVEKCESIVGIPAIYIQATPDLMMGDLLKNMRSSQIFSVCGLPEIKVHAKKEGKETRYQVELLGYDVFDPGSMEVVHRNGDNVPAWFLDTDYNDLCFHVGQAFFPRTGAWDNLKKALKVDYGADVWDHLAGTTSAPFVPGEHAKIAVKVIDDRGNELLVVKDLKAAK